MSRKEIDVDTYKCPCGTGEIEKTVESTDYVFSSAHVMYKFRCPRCDQLWRLADGALVLKESEKPYITAREELRAANMALRRCIHEIAQLYCQREALTTKKAEYEHLESIDLYRKTYATYLKQRKEGNAMHDIIMLERPLPLLQWAKLVAESLGMASTLFELLASCKRCDDNASIVEKEIIRRPLK